jgi:hypothetical protein
VRLKLWIRGREPLAALAAACFSQGWDPGERIAADHDLGLTGLAAVDQVGDHLAGAIFQQKAD